MGAVVLNNFTKPRCFLEHFWMIGHLNALATVLLTRSCSLHEIVTTPYLRRPLTDWVEIGQAVVLTCILPACKISAKSVH